MTTDNRGVTTEEDSTPIARVGRHRLFAPAPVPR